MAVWLTPDDVAERLGVARRTAMAMMHQMPHSNIGGKERKRLRVSEEALDAWVISRAEGNRPVVSTIGTGSRKKLGRR